MTAFPINDVRWDAPQQYTSDAATKSQDSYLVRKMVARMRFKPGDTQSLNDPERPSLLKRLRRLGNQAVESPSSNATLFRKMRIESEQKLGQAALGYMMKRATASGVDLNDPQVAQAHIELIHPGRPPSIHASPEEKNQFAIKKAQSDAFWNEFLATPEARTVTNSTSYLHTHAHHANGFATRFVLRTGRLLGELGHVILAPTTIFTKMYRHTLDGLTRSNGLISSSLYCVGALTTLSLLAAYRAGESVVAPFSVVALFPLYGAAMASCMIAKVLDSVSWRLGFSPSENSKAMVSIRECAQNRLAEQLVGLAKVQNHFATKVSENDQIYVDMARDYSNEQADRKAKTVTGGAAKWASNFANPESTNNALARARSLNETLLFSRMPVDGLAPVRNSPASAKSVLQQIFANHTEAVEELSDADRDRPGVIKKLVKTQLRSLGGAVKVFSGPRASGLIHEHSRLGDKDHVLQDFEEGYDPNTIKVVDGDHPFPDRQVREHLEHIFSWVFDKTRLHAARGLCFLAGTTLGESSKYMHFKWGLQGVLHRTARSISVGAESTRKYPFRDGLPAPVRKWLPKGGYNANVYFAKETREIKRHAPAMGSLAHIDRDTQSYSKLTQSLYKAHKALALIAEKYIQPVRGNGGRIIDGVIRKKLTGSVGQATTHYLSYAGSVAMWGFAITPNFIIQEAAGLSGYPELLGTGIIPTAIGFVAGTLATTAAALTLLSAAGHRPDLVH